MRVTATSLFTLLTLSATISAQSETDNPTQLPPCITTCSSLATIRVSCNTIDPKCICGSDTLFNFVRNCLQTGDSTCTVDETRDALSKLKAECADKVSSAFPSLSFTIGPSEAPSTAEMSISPISTGP